MCSAGKLALHFNGGVRPSCTFDKTYVNISCTGLFKKKSKLAKTVF